MFRVLGKLPTLSVPHFSFKIIVMTCQSQYHSLEKRIYHAHIINQLCSLLGTSSSISFPWAGAASQGLLSSWVEGHPQESRMPDCKIFLVGSVLCWSLWEWLLLMYRGLWESCGSSVHGSRDLKHKTLWAINTVSSSIKSSYIWLPQSSSPTSLLPWLHYGVLRN